MKFHISIVGTMGISHAFVAIVALLPCGSAWVWLPMMRQASSWLQVRPNPTGTAVLGTPGAAWHGRSSRAVHMTALDGEDDAETVEALKTKVLAMEQALAQTQAAFADAMVKHHERRLAESQEAAKTLKQGLGLKFHLAGHAGARACALSHARGSLLLCAVAGALTRFTCTTNQRPGRARKPRSRLFCTRRR